MIFQFSNECLELMKEKGKKNIIVEIATSDSSDFEITELHVHLIKDKDVEFFVRKKGFTCKEADGIKVLLPNYKLEYAPVISFGVKKVLFFRVLTYEGIKL